VRWVAAGSSARTVLICADVRLLRYYCFIDKAPPGDSRVFDHRSVKLSGASKELPPRKYALSLDLLLVSYQVA